MQRPGDSERWKTECKVENNLFMRNRRGEKCGWSIVIRVTALVRIESKNKESGGNYTWNLELGIGGEYG